MVTAFEMLDVDERVKVIVVTGDVQGRHFCAGADLSPGLGLERTEGVGGKGHRDGYVTFSFFFFRWIFGVRGGGGGCGCGCG